MNSLNSLYFPGTTLHSISQYPLFLLFPKVHLLKIAEDNIHRGEVQATDSFVKSGFCQPFIPNPLGKDLDRFFHLVSDIQNRKDDYASQLSSLTLAAMSAPHSMESGDSQQEIISTLLGGGQLFQDKQKKLKNLDLWQARLMLAIGEILDHEEADIARELASLKEDEAYLFRELQGEGDALEEEDLFDTFSQLRDSITPPTSDNMKKRFLSWKKLYKEGNSPACNMILTTSRDSADQILDTFNIEDNETTIYSEQLSLPAIIGRQEDDALQQTLSYRENNKELINEITETLLQLINSTSLAKDRQQGSALSNIRGPWEKSLEAHFPAGKFGRIPLSFYCFAGMSCSTLLGVDKQDSTHVNSLMAIADIFPAGACPSFPAC